MGNKPSKNSVYKWILSTLQHVNHVEYYRQMLVVGYQDPQQGTEPHDIYGKGNKFELEVIYGMSYQFYYPTATEKSPFFQKYVQPAIDRHRKYQFHHQRWNWYHPDASEDNLRMGALDAICSMREARGYNGGPHSFNSILKKAKKGLPHQKEYIEKVVEAMMRMIQPDFMKISSLVDVPNIGIPKKVYDKICKYLDETLEMIKNEYGYDLKY